jgi:hypothetical protein
MHDFSCTDAADMYYDLMANRTRYLKETPEGVREMCKAMEDMRNETARKTVLKTIISLMKTTKWTFEQTLTNMEIPTEDWSIYRAMLPKS